MLPKDIDALTGQQLTRIAQDTAYATQLSSKLLDQQWREVQARLLADGLAQPSLTDEIILTPEGREIASRGARGYKRFRRKRDRELGDTLLTNLFSRWGAVATIIATGLSLYAIFKPDESEKSIKVLEQKQQALRVTVESLSIRQQRLSAKQDSLIQLLSKKPHEANPLLATSHAVLPSRQAIPKKGSATTTKRKRR